MWASVFEEETRVGVNVRVTPWRGKVVEAIVEAVGGPKNAPKGEVTRHDASPNQDNRQVFRQTETQLLELVSLNSVVHLVSAVFVSILLSACVLFS